ncbi:MAG TPA: copper transporter [Pseudonocardiaceae bacterium]
MISLRYHIVSVAAVFLAIALGVVLGSTTVSDRLLSGLNDDNDSLTAQVDDLRGRTAEQERRLTAAERFAAAAGPLAVRGRLDRRTVAIVSTADADPADRDAIAALVAASGAGVVGEVQLTDAFTASARADQLRELVTRLPAGVQLPTDGDPGTLAGGLLGALLLLDPADNKPQASAEESAAALGGLADGGFLRVGADLRPAQLAIVLTGGAASGDGAGDRAAMVARFAAQLDRSGAGTVLVGRSASASGTGPVGVARADTAVTSILSTVDGTETAAGRIATVLALGEQLEGAAGRYGTAANAESVAPGAAAG